MYRLYVDEVGHDALTHLDKDKHRYLSLTGVAMKIEHARDILGPRLNGIKADIFDHDPDAPIVFHRKEILGFKGCYGCLKTDPNKQTAFNSAILGTFNETPYAVITALIDKFWMTKQDHWALTHPYNYLMNILVEKYVQFLERKSDIGDIMPESREGKDSLLQRSYTALRGAGTEYVTPERIKSALRGDKLKFRKKTDNIAGLQLCDLIAHPSHIYVRSKMGHAVQLGDFSIKVSGILEGVKYDRSPYNGKIKGYGYKHLPQ